MADSSPPRSAVGSDTSDRRSIRNGTSDKGVELKDVDVTAKTSLKMSTVVEGTDPNANPFKMPPDNDIFLMRDKERQQKKQERLLQRKLRVEEKTTYAQRMNRRVATLVKTHDEDNEDEDDQGQGVDQDDKDFTLQMTRDRRVERECLSDYISKKREMFLIQYSLGVKRDEMRKLEEIAAMEERKLELSEQYLEEDAALFDEFLKENDKSSGDAIKIAESETKAKLEKVAEIKKLNSQMMAIRSEISKYEDTLKEYELYRQFLETLSPKAWVEERRMEEEVRRARKKGKSKIETAGTDAEPAKQGTSKIGGMEKRMEEGKGGRVSSPSRPSDESSGGGGRESKEDEDYEEEPQLYFTDPQQLLDIFAELEEQNLSLIQNSQETEETLEEMKQNVRATKAKMEKETDILKEQIDKLTTAILKEEEKAKELETKARMFSYGEFKSDDQEKMLVELNRKVEEVYRSCIGDNEANISTLQMLTNIENRLEDLFQQIEMMPRDKVEAAEKAKEKERRLKQREEKMEQQRLHQEERIKRALERAKAEPKKKTGRRLVPRSEPPQLKKHEDIDLDAANREEEELAYYFMP